MIGTIVAFGCRRRAISSARLARDLDQGAVGATFSVRRRNGMSGAVERLCFGSLAI
jgi:hypothetical protein